MVSSVLEQYQISDFLDWYEKKRLVLNPEFQRRNVWTTPAKSFLIDTILRKLPVPKIYMRTKIDLKTRLSIREIVDGQQRLRAIMEFANDRLVLTKQAEEFRGLKYSSLDEEHKETFLTYSIAVEQLINASDSDVLEVFSRLNSYTVSLNHAEKRHAKYTGNFKWAVYKSAEKWKILWEKYKVVSVRQRLRMMDDSLMAEIFSLFIKGVTDGGQPRINKLYAENDPIFEEDDVIVRKVDATLGFIVEQLDEVLIDAVISSAPHFLMLVAAIAHALFGIPDGEMGDRMPSRDPSALSNLNIVKENLSTLNSIIESDESDAEFAEFWRASISSTQRISSRKIRFPFYYRALLPKSL